MTDLEKLRQYDRRLVRGMWAIALLFFVALYLHWETLSGSSFLLLLVVTLLRIRSRRKLVQLSSPGPEQPARHALLKSLAIALPLALTDVFMTGWPVFSIFIFASALLNLGGIFSARHNPPLARQRTGKAAALLAVAILAGTAIHYDAQLPESRAASVADALRQYKMQHGRYPAQLQELVPDFLPGIPRPRLAAAAGEFRYSPDTNDPGLMWAVAPPYGRATLRIDSGQRSYID